MRTYNEIREEKEKIINNIKRRKTRSPMYMPLFLIVAFSIMFLCGTVFCMLSIILNIFLGASNILWLPSLLFALLQLFFIFLCYKAMQSPFQKRECESVTLYSEYFEHKYETKKKIFVYRIAYKDITVFHLFDREVILISSKKINVREKDKKTLSSSEKNLVKDKRGIKQHKILFCFEQGDEMYNEIKEQIRICAERYRQAHKYLREEID